MPISGKNKLLKYIKALTAICVLLYILPYCQANTLKAYHHVTYVPSPGNDGDSFRIRIGTTNITLRLYYVDCPETGVTQSTDARRVRTQTRYFGMPDHRTTVFYGKEAAEFTRSQLSEPFTVYTAKASAPGRSKGGRFYGFVKTAEGKDLATLLVTRGYARAYGVGCKTPDGISRREMTARLADTENAAMLSRAGIWSATDERKLVDLRAEERREMAKLAEIKDQLTSHPAPLNINTASEEELRTLPGIGTVLCTRIIAARPFTDKNELLQIKGITKKRFTKIAPYINEIK